jgi:hypothetical protein
LLRPASHQSARYELRVGGQAESQSSSGLIVATGTGQSGRSRSIRSERRSVLEVPAPTDPSLTLFVRKAWPSVETGAELTEALVGSEPAEVVSRMDEGGGVFGDGIQRGDQNTRDAPLPRVIARHIATGRRG